MVEQCYWYPATCVSLLVYCNKTLSLSLTSDFSNRNLLCRAGSLVPHSAQPSVWRATENMSDQGNMQCRAKAMNSAPFVSLSLLG